MTDANTIIGAAKPADGYAVRRPRATDAIGLSLRGAFDGALRLPEDMIAALAALDRKHRS